jgi:hypothetical protein
MKCFFGDRLDDWFLWGVWIRETWFIGVSKAVREQVS